MAADAQAVRWLKQWKLEQRAPQLGLLNGMVAMPEVGQDLQAACVGATDSKMGARSGLSQVCHELNGHCAGCLSSVATACS